MSNLTVAPVADSIDLGPTISVDFEGGVFYTKVSAGWERFPCRARPRFPVIRIGASDQTGNSLDKGMESRYLSGLIIVFSTILTKETKDE